MVPAFSTAIATSTGQAWNRESGWKANDQKKLNILEVNGAQLKDSKCLANKIGDTLAELSSPQNYDPTFLELKQKEEQKTLHVIHTNEENYNKPFSKGMSGGCGQNIDHDHVGTAIFLSISWCHWAIDLTKWWTPPNCLLTWMVQLLWQTTIIMTPTHVYSLCWYWIS